MVKMATMICLKSTISTISYTFNLVKQVVYLNIDGKPKLGNPVVYYHYCGSMSKSYQQITTFLIK